MNFPSTFGPIGPAASWPIRPFGPLGPTSLLLPLPHPGRARKPPTPAGLALPPWSSPTTSTEGKKLPYHTSFILPINVALSPLESSSIRRLQTGSIQAPPVSGAFKPAVHKFPQRLVVFENISRYTPSHFQKLQIGPYNFFSPYLCNRNSKSSDSCAKILRITSSFILWIHFMYVCCIY
jgi:hypothetical protein